MARPPSSRQGGLVYTQYENLHVYGSFLGAAASEVSGDVTITEPTGVYNVDASSGDVTITLPTLVAGYSYTIRKANRTGGDVIISGTINGNATTTLTGSTNPSVNVMGFSTEWGLV